MGKLVTIGIPVYKRLEYLPNVLSIVASQDYPDIDLLVSDNGMNGTAVPTIVDKCYPKPYRFRQNVSSVSGSSHYNQLIHNASGEYVTVLADDDEISPNFVSELVRLLEQYPEASAALAIEETIDEAGNVIKKSKDTVPEILSGSDFIRTTWGTREYRFQSLCTFLAKRERLIALGGFPDIWAATSDEDLLMIKLCLDSWVVFSKRCAFRKRYYESSGGYAIFIQDLARGIREFLACLASDPRILEYSASHPDEWHELRGYVIASAWKTYYFRWINMYRNRMSPSQWAMAGFALPPSYYRKVASILARVVGATVLAHVRKFPPQAHDTYQAMKARLRKMA
jgi:glycosyltransferase involved in cell wall biosynthesis